MKYLSKPGTNAKTAKSDKAVETVCDTLEMLLSDWVDDESELYTEAMDAITILREGLKNEIFK